MTAAASGPTGRSHLPATTDKPSTRAIASWSAPVLWSFTSRRANTEKQWTTKHVRTTTQKAAEDSRTPRRYRDSQVYKRPTVEAIIGRLPAKR